MGQLARVIPEEAQLLCEGCGYIVSGLPTDSRCPECAKPIAESLPELRVRPAWEQDEGNAPERFWTTTWAILRHPTGFYRTLATRTVDRRSHQFGMLHLWISSFLFSLAGLFQFQWMLDLPGFDALFGQTLDHGYLGAAEPVVVLSAVMLTCLVGAFWTIVLLTKIAARLTAWEAAYRGLRLPHEVVMRGLHYHAPHYLPVAALAFLTVAAYRILLAIEVLDVMSGPRYLYFLSAEVFFAAAYLFGTYWKAMRNMMYANR
jgi:hypothetical protein